MNSDEHDDDLIERARAAVDREVGNLDAATRSRLVAARRAALAELEAPRRSFTATWVPVGAAAVVAVIAVGVALNPRAPVPEAGVEADTAIELLLTDDDFVLYEDDLEFYAWLDESGPEADGDAG